MELGRRRRPRRRPRRRAAVRRASGPRAPASPRTASSSTAGSPSSATSSTGATTGTSRCAPWHVVDPGRAARRRAHPPLRQAHAARGPRARERDAPGVRHLVRPAPHRRRPRARVRRPAGVRRGGAPALVIWQCGADERDVSSDSPPLPIPTPSVAALAATAASSSRTCCRPTSSTRVNDEVEAAVDAADPDEALFNPVAPGRSTARTRSRSRACPASRRRSRST